MIARVLCALMCCSSRQTSRFSACRVHAKSASLIEAMHVTKLMMAQFRATIAQAECLPGAMKGDHSPVRRFEGEYVVIPFGGAWNQFDIK